MPIHLVVVEATSRCNLRCIHCYNNDADSQIAEIRSSLDLADDQDIECLLSEIEKIKPHYITISGGEPLLLRDGLLPLANKCKRHCRKLFLTTNGQLIQDFSAESFVVFDDVQISLDGTKSIHEMIRGAGTFSRAIESAGYLKRAGIAVSFHMTLNSLNINDLTSAYKISKEMGIPFGIERMSAVGRGKQVGPISSAEWKLALGWALENGIGCGDPLRSIFRECSNKPNKITGGCMAGIASIAITPNLDVLPCVRLRMPLGNLRTQTVDDIWNNSKVLMDLRDRKGFSGRCGACRLWNSCGGCRADAFAYTGDHLQSDPLCWLNKPL